MNKIYLKKGKEEPIRRQHPWIFSGAVGYTEGVLEDGDLVEVYDSKKQFLAVGYYNDGSIVVRVLSFQPCVIDADFWNKKLQNAYHYRQKLDLTDSESTNCYRLIHAEGDGLPGLIVDIYGSVGVVQCHSIGMHRQIEHIKNGLIKVFGQKLKAIYDKSYETLPPQYITQNEIKNGYLFGEAEVPMTVFENGNAFAVDWITGQKTGFFLDQRDNRALLSRYAKDKSVLNAFCYSGGFSVYGLKAGAKSVHSIDISPRAMDLTEKNVGLNASFEGEHTAAAVDVMAFLKENERIFDVMVVDPPAFAKSINKRHNAVQAYKRLNAMALRQITEGGILFTFSCSQVVDTQLFYDTIVAAAIEAGRHVRVMHRLTQPADHPVNIFHPEGSYLKGLVLYVE
jgi:23S rRNA (cytosine1962-C5)-methyltransferase